MPQEQAPRLSHVGLYVTDVPKMTDFYTTVLGFVVSDRAEDGRITFLSRNPSDHHQLVRAVAARVGPLATTSANRHGEPTAATAQGASDALGPDLALVVDGGLLEGARSVSSVLHEV